MTDSRSFWTSAEVCGVGWKKLSTDTLRSCSDVWKTSLERETKMDVEAARGVSQSLC